MSQLVTGEAVALDLRTAGVPSRALAAFLDACIQGVLLFLLVLVVGAVASTGNEAQTATTLIVTVVLVGIGYPVGFETLLRGRTPGKMALGLRVVRDDGGPIGFRQAFVRGLLGFVVEKPGITSGAGAVLTALLNEHGKRLGDFAAGTIVIQERVVAAPPAFVPMPPPLAGWATMLDLTRLPDDLALSSRAFLLRHSALTPTAQEDLGSRLANAMAAVVTPAPPPGTPHWAYLSAVLAERRRRAEQSAWGTAGPPAPAAYGYWGPGAPPPAPAPKPRPAMQPVAPSVPVEPTGPFAPPS